MNLYLIIGSVLLNVLITYGIFKLGQSKSISSFWFWIALLLPYTVPTALVLYLITQGALPLALATFLLIIFLLERFGWAITLEELSGRNKFGGFYFVYNIPLIWIFYWILK